MSARKPARIFLRIALISVVSVLAGLVLLQFNPFASSTGSSRIYLLVSRGLVQLGLLGVLVSVLQGGYHLVVKSASDRPRFAWMLKLAFSLAVMFVTGEVFLRVVYRDGLSFRHHHGPMVQRFERDFTLNRYDGPSRGPELDSLESDRSLRIMIQGDSVTWGQGIKQEEVLFSSRLEDALRLENPDMGMAVLAMPGRDIDGHVEQLEKWGEVLQPDVILYQWHVNDIELDKTRRPGKRNLFWQGLFFHDLLQRNTYLWFFLDDRLTTFWPIGSPVTYTDYLAQEYARDTDGWRAFAEQFLDWAERARALTPRVLVVLYPYNPRAFALEEIHVQMTELADEAGVDWIDLVAELPEFGDASFDLEAGPFDGHPSAAMHGRMADELEERLVELWPEIIAGSGQETEGDG